MYKDNGCNRENCMHIGMERLGARLHWRACMYWPRWSLSWVILMNKFLVLMIAVLAVVLMWVAYYYGYGNGLKTGIDQQYSSIYASSKVQLKVLELLNNAETQRAENALQASVESDISFLNDIKTAKEELTISALLLGSLASLTREEHVYHTMEDKDVSQLKSRLGNIMMNKE